MATIGNDIPTLLDVVKRTDPNGAIANIAEVLTRKNPFLEDMAFQEGNLSTGHRFTSRTALPSVGWRRFNEGVSPSKSQVAQVDETCGMLEGFSVVDVELAKLNGNEAAFRASEDKAFLQSLNNEVETGIIYHSAKTAPEKFMGIIPRLDTLNANFQAASQIIDGGGRQNDNTSILLICWGPETAFGISPKGSSAGIQPTDMGVQLWDDGAGKKYRAYVTNWTWKLGVVVKDWRYIVRICNIDVSDLIAPAGKTADSLVPLMIDAMYRLPDFNSGRCAWYCNRTVMSVLHHQARNTTKNSTLTIDTIEGRPVASLGGIPIRQADAILNSEATVS